MKTVIIKLGGSIITNKQGGRPAVRVAIVKRLAQELRRAYQHDPTRRLVLLHGAGSFGHPLAHRHQLHGRLLTPEVLAPLRQILASVNTLTTSVTEICRQAGLPVVLVDTNSAVREVRSQLRLIDPQAVKRVVDRGDIPVLSGNMVVADEQRLAVASADRLASLFAQTLAARELVFATDVDGVYAQWPKGKQRPIQRLNRAQLERLVERMTVANTDRDVTGAMAGKLRALLALKKRSIIIGSGHTSGFLTTALLRQTNGTVIRV